MRRGRRLNHRGTTSIADKEKLPTPLFAVTGKPGTSYTKTGNGSLQCAAHERYFGILPACCLAPYGSSL